MENSYEKDLPWIDTHTHLHAKRFNRERGNILRWMQDTGIRNIEIPIEYDSNFLMREKLAGFENARFAAGVHPTRVSKITAKDARKQLEKLAVYPDTVAIGETGLDFHVATLDTEFVNQMEEWFEYFLDLADQVNLPVILHTREADERILEILKKKRRQFKGVIHCFQGDIKLANQYMEFGFYLGIGGLVTYTDRCSVLRKAMTDIPIERIVLETDCPYLTPEPLEGYNTPKNLPLIAETIAELKDLDAGKVKAENVKNAQTLFGLW